MRTLLGIVFCFCVVYLPFTRGQCGWSFGSANIDDTEVNKEIFSKQISDFEFQSWDITSVDGGLSKNTALSYFTNGKNDTSFWVQTTETFRNINQDAYTDGQTTLTIVLVVTLKCNEKNENSTLMVQVTNTNQYPPQFSEEAYNYSLPMPIMPKTDFSLYGSDLITATDIDFSTTKITFSLDSDDFSVTSSKVENKKFKAVFSANKIIRLDESKTYTLTATDSGSSPKSTPIKVTLNVDATASVDSPSFSQSYYSFNYTNGETPTLVPNDGPIVIQSDKSDTCLYELVGEYSSLFSLSFENTTKIFTISIKSGSTIPEDVSSPIILTLNYTTDTTVFAVILITVISTDSVPKFSNDYYIGTYDTDANKITWNEPINVTGASSIEIKGDKASLFTVDPSTYELTPKKPLNKTEFDDNSNLVVTLVATSKVGESHATVLISLLSSTEFKFDNVYYTGVYSIKDNNPEVSLDSDVGFTDLEDYSGIVITVDEKYSDNFKFEVVSSKWKVTVSKKLDTALLNSNTELSIPITATQTSDSSTSSAILILTLPATIKFTNVYYTAKYIKGSGTALATITLDNEISVEGADSTEISITPDEYTGNFKFELESSKWKITVLKDLDSTLLNSNTELSIPITATRTSDSSISSAILVLTLPATIKFTSAYYTAKYIKGSGAALATITLDNEISVEGADTSEISITPDAYTENFKFELESSKWKITVLKDLDSALFNSNTELSIPITATQTSDSSTSSAILVLTLPTIIKFTSAYYTAKYIKGSGTALATITLDNEISVEGADSSEISITPDAYTGNFKFELESSRWKITVLKDLDSALLNSNTELSIPITATQSSNSSTSSAILVLTLPATIKFTNAYYTAKYIKGSGTALATITLDNEISVEGADSTDISITPDAYTENFKFELESSKWKITVLKDLDSVLFNSNTELSIPITAIKTSDSLKSSAVLILTLPTAIKFTDTYYTAKYIKGSGTALATITLDNEISVDGADASEITLAPDAYTKNFKFELESSKWKITVLKDLDSTLLNSNTELSLTITATKTSDSSKSSAVLILKLPVAIKFTDTYYTAKYIKGSGTALATITLDNEISVEGADVSEITIVPDGYSENFEILLDGSKWKINVLLNLDTTVLTANTELSIPITAKKSGDSTTSTAILVLKLPDKVNIEFTSPYYTAQYIKGSDTDDLDSITLDQDIVIKGVDTEDITVTLDGYNDNFDIAFNSSTKAYGIGVKKNLDPSILVSNTQLIIQITASTTDKTVSGNTVMVLKFPEKTSSLIFENKHYYAEYSVNSATSVASVKFADSSIKVTGANANEIEFAFEEYGDNFEMVFNSESSSYDINVIKNLDFSALESTTELIITIYAANIEGSATGSTVLILKLPDNTTSVVFENNYYIAQYIIDSATSVASVKFTESSIKITGVDPNEIKFTIKGYNENFEMNYDTISSAYDINVVNSLNASVIDSNTELIIPITATEIDGTATGSTILILKLPNKTSSLVFEKKHYAAEYSVDSVTSKASVKYTDDSIKITGADSTEVQFAFEDYNKNFEIKYNTKSSAYDINVISNLEPSVLNSKRELIITITVTRTDDSATDTTVLIIKLPDKTSSLIFEKTHYTAEYSVDSATSKASIKMTNSSIKITGADSEELQFMMEGYNENFQMTYNKNFASYDINVVKNLDASIFDSKTELIITITATNSNGSATGNTVLILKLPEKTKSLVFENEHYAAEYVIDSATYEASVKLTNSDIKINGAESKELEFTFEGYNENFAIEYNSESSAYDISVSKKLDTTVLNSNTQLIITIMATKIDGTAASSTVLILKLPDKTSSLTFENIHYAAEYSVDSESGSQATVKFTDSSIKINGADSDELQFSLEGYNENFEVKYNEDSSAYDINVIKNLNNTILDSKTELIITLTATKKDSSATDNTVLVLKLPDKKSIQFEKQHYTAEYIVDSTTSEASVKFTNDSLRISDIKSDDIRFTFEGYNENFAIVYNSESSAYDIRVAKELNTTVLNSETQLIITIMATKIDGTVACSTVLILKLPDNTTSLVFDNIYYAADYSVDAATSKATVKFTDSSIKITGADSDELQFSLEGYNENFEVKYNKDSSAYDINVIKNLNDTILDSETELIITLTATKKDDSATDNTVLVLKLPDKKSIQFEKQHYMAEYIVDSTESEASVHFINDSLKISGPNSDDIRFAFESFEDNFDLMFDSKTLEYNVIVKKLLNESILSSNSELIITITASTKSSSILLASTVLVLKLPSNKIFTSVFEYDYYVATYKQSNNSDNDEIEINPGIKINDAKYAEVGLGIEGYEENFVGTCESSTLKCSITVQKNLNISTTSSFSEILMTVSASTKDEISKGTTVLLLKLPSKNSTFNFGKQHYTAIYTIQNADNDKAIVELNDLILFENAALSEVTIVTDDYSKQFSFVFDSQNSKWNLIVDNNLDSDILSNHTELITSLTAQKEDKEDFSKATLVIKLPDKITMTFLKLQYSGEYVIADNGTAWVNLIDEIETTDNNIEITLDSYTTNFEVVLDSTSKWSIKLKSPFDLTIFTNHKQLKMLMTVTKAGVKYGQAALTIKLPDPSFTKGFYIATYTEDASASINLQDPIAVNNVEVAYIHVNLSNYNDYIYTELEEGNWTLKLAKPLPADVTEHYEILLITLEAIRSSDNTQLATSTLVVKLPDINSTDTPKFKQFAFYGEYKNSTDRRYVDLTDLIDFSNSDIVKIDTVEIDEDSSKYSSNFKVTPNGDGTYYITVEKDLSTDVLSTEISIVLTLMASTEEGKKGYAVLVINLPKLPRETSVQFKDEEILYSGTYENGTFKSPSITLETNSTDSSQISVEITNELGVDNKYFKSKYSNRILTVDVDELPEDTLKKYTVIPLKLAITDKDTGDTVHAVLNVNINYNTDNDGGNGNDPTSGNRTALLIAVIILACLLVGTIAAVFFLWYCKIRNAKYAEMDEEKEEKPETKQTSFTKNLTRQISNPSTSSQLRRPTGLPIGFIKSESPIDEVSSDFEIVPSAPPPLSEYEKKVAFNDQVQKIDDPEINIENEDSPGKLQNVADRRPTQFVFAYPAEEIVGDLDSPTERRESSDYVGFDPEKKKTVVFDDNVERMDIDVIEDEDNDDNNKSDNEEVTESYGVTPHEEEEPENYKSEIEIKVEEPEPSEIIKLEL